LIGRQILGMLHYHDLFLVPFRIPADRAQFTVGQCLAAFTVAHMLFCLHDGRRKLRCLLLGHTHDMKRQPLRRLCADPRQAGQLFDQLVDISTVMIHQNGKPPPSPIPPVSLDIAAEASSSTLRSASLVAAMIRSSSISISSGSTTSSWIFTAVTTFLPEMVTSTAPPPSDAVNSLDRKSTRLNS